MFYVHDPECKCVVFCVCMSQILHPHAIDSATPQCTLHEIQKSLFHHSPITPTENRVTYVQS